MKKILLLLIAALTMTMASAKDIKTVVLTTVPQMHCENCEKRIKENIRFEKGVKKIVTDVEQKSAPTCRACTDAFHNIYIPSSRLPGEQLYHCNNHPSACEK